MPGFLLYNWNMYWIPSEIAEKSGRCGTAPLRICTLIVALGLLACPKKSDQPSSTKETSRVVAAPELPEELQPLPPPQAKAAAGSAPEPQRVLGEKSGCQEARLLAQKSTGLVDKDGPLAIAQVRQALQLCPSQPELQQLLANVLLHVGLREKNPRLRRDYLQQSIGLEDSAVARAHLGEMAFADNELAAAIDLYEKALLLEPDNQRLQQRLAQLQKNAGVENDFHQDRGQHFVALFEGTPQRELAVTSLQQLEQAYDAVGRELDLYPKQPITVVIYTGDQFSRATNSPDWAGGIYDGKIRLRGGDLGSASSALTDLLYHEYVHALLAQNLAVPLPGWFHEGLAQYLEPGGRPVVDPAVDSPTLSQMSPPLTSIANRQQVQLAYRASLSLVRRMVEMRGQGSLPLLLEQIGDSGDFASAFEEIYGRDLQVFEREWRGDL